MLFIFIDNNILRNNIVNYKLVIIVDNIYFFWFGIGGGGLLK